MRTDHHRTPPDPGRLPERSLDAKQLDRALLRVTGRLVRERTRLLLSTDHPFQNPAGVREKARKQLLGEIGYDPLIAEYLRRVLS